MDNLRIGNFIKEQRKERGLTQKQLADKLHITDRAVSKWERGLSAPDIALLEPLAEVLGVSVTELLKGERQPESTPSEETEEAVRGFLDYSKSAAAERLRRFRKRYLSLTLYALLLLMIVAGLWLWHNGVFFIIGRSDAPGGAYSAVLYDRDYLNYRPWKGDEMMLKITQRDSGTYSYSTFSASENFRMEWSPDGRRLLIDAGSSIELCRPYMGSMANLSALLSDAPEQLGIPADAEYRFLMWGDDSDHLLFSYQSAEKSGCFWFSFDTFGFSGAVDFDMR